MLPAFIASSSGGADGKASPVIVVRISAGVSARAGMRENPAATAAALVANSVRRLIITRPAFIKRAVTLCSYGIFVDRIEMQRFYANGCFDPQNADGAAWPSLDSQICTF